MTDSLDWIPSPTKVANDAGPETHRHDGYEHEKDEGEVWSERGDDCGSKWVSSVLGEKGDGKRTSSGSACRGKRSAKVY